MRLGLSLILTVLFLGGCGKQPMTVDGVDFLRLQLAQAPPAQSEMGWYANYDRCDGGFHYLLVRRANFMNVFKTPYEKEWYRCRTEALPETYPADIDDKTVMQFRIQGTSQSVGTHRQQIDDFIRAYLQKHGKLTPAADRKLSSSSDDWAP